MERGSNPPEASFGGVPLSSYLSEHQEWTLGDFEAKLRGPFLLLKVGEDDPWVINLGEHPEVLNVEFGRGSDCQVTVDEETVSRRHGLLEFDGTSWAYIDLGSSNGSFTTRALQAYTPLPLSSGDEVILGKRSRLTFFDVVGFFVFLHPGMQAERDRGEEKKTGTRRARMFETRATRRMSRMSRRVRPQLLLEQQRGQARSLSRLIHDMSSSSFEDFESFFPHPVLVLLAVSNEAPSDVRPMRDSSLQDIKEVKIDLKNQEFWILASSADPHCVFVGRASNNDVVLERETISRRHAQFRNEERADGSLQWSIMSLSDRAGIWVDGRLIDEETRLDDSVVLRLGQGNKYQFMTPRAFFDFISLFQEYPYLNH